MVLLGDEAQVEAQFILFGYGANLDTSFGSIEKSDKITVDYYHLI
jgi:hypothetical protein